MSRVAIAVQEVSKRFVLRNATVHADGASGHDHWALHNVSFQIDKGLSVGIIGPNGSGKSTLLKILSGVTKPSGGRVEVRGRIGSILDIGAGFHQELSGRDNILLHGQTLGFRRSEIAPHVDAIIAFSELRTAIDEPVKNYSNGMFLRLAFSIIAHLDFDVYLFDEVLSVGDARFMAKSKQRIQELGAMGRTIVHVSHSISEMNDKDMYIMLEKGRLVEIDRSSRLLLDYQESSFLKGGNHIARSPVTLKSDNLVSSPKLCIHSFSLYHRTALEEQNLRTDLPLTIDLTYGLKNISDPVDIILLFRDVAGNPVFQTGAFLNSQFNHAGADHFSCSCTVPSGTFHGQVYRLSVLFLTNVQTMLSEAQKNFGKKPAEDANTTDTVETLLRYDDIIVFRPEFRIAGVEVALDRFNVAGSLFVNCEWRIDNSESDDD